MENNPPKWATRLLHRACPDHLLEEVEGDLQEEYQYQLRKVGKRQADWDYAINVIGFLSPFSRRRKSEHYRPSLFSTIMLKNYFVTAMRNIARNRTYSIINLVGLTFGLVSSMLIFQFVIYERSADEFHAKFDQLNRVTFKVAEGGGTSERQSQLYLTAGQAFKDEIPAVANMARIRADFFQECPTLSHTTNGERKTYKDIRSIMVDSTFLKMFSFELVRGNAATALAGKSILITESTAIKLFGYEDPIGKTIEYGMISGGPRTERVPSLQVTGVLKDAPANSHIQFDVMIPLHIFVNGLLERVRPYYNSWGNNNFTTYVELQPGADRDKVAEMMNTIVERQAGEILKRIGTTVSVELQPMSKVYFDRETNLGLVGFGSAVVSTRTGNERMVYFLTLIAIITLAIALMSYVNLSTIRSLDRAKEVGIRKVIGAYKHNLQMQFFMESTMMNLAGLVIAVILVMLLVPYFNDFVQTNFTLTSWFNSKFLLLISGIFVTGVLLSGLYPAFILSSFMPIKVLKGSVGSLGSKSRMRKFLIVLQYAPAISLLVCTMVVYTQLDFMRNMDVGLDMNKLVTIRSPFILPDSIPTTTAEAAFKKEVVRIPEVEFASFAGNQAGRGLNFLVPFKVDSVGDSGVRFYKCSGVDHDFTSAFSVKVVAGEPFTDGMTNTYGNPDDFTRKVMVNETAVRSWGIKKNEDVIGRVAASEDGDRFYVMAVLEDFNWSSVHKAIDPVMLWYTPFNRFMTIKVKPGADLNSMLSQVKTVYEYMFPMDVFHYEFADDVYKRQYGEDEKFAKLFGIFSGLAALIASLGLFGLASFSAERRSKEVGIRKVMGASVNSIVGLLGREFIMLVFVAFVIASPIAWFVMNGWLQTFAFHIPLNAIPFIITGIGAVLIAVVTVSWRTIRVARENPIKSLRDE
ncbi:MAG TPA: ABC transporter permease [Cyclobacteriaceae bacterium]|nr:ABC transporter permease [Cyclobacteriaceae bacterium]